MNKLSFLAGKKAYKKIKENGLSPEDVGVCVSASGAAKWLCLYGLDKSVFGVWLKKRKTPVNFFGTSIGAWKFAAACSKDSSKAFDLLAEGYINQRYGRKTTPSEVSSVGVRILDEFIKEENIKEILNHEFYRLSFSAVRYLRGNEPPGAAKLLRAGILNAFKRENLGSFFERTFFMDERDIPSYSAVKGFPIKNVILDEKNLKRALLASGSIPYLMEAVKNIPGCDEGVFLDGGIIDYHPVFDFTGGMDKIVLYHHFYDYLIPGWFDKKFPWRRPGSRDLENVLLVSPSAEFVKSLPGGKIPDRKDFKTFLGRDDQRISNWREAKKRSLELGDEFLEVVETGKIKDLIVEI